MYCLIAKGTPNVFSIDFYNNHNYTKVKTLLTLATTPHGDYAHFRNTQPRPVSIFNCALQRRPLIDFPGGFF